MTTNRPSTGATTGYNQTLGGGTQIRQPLTDPADKDPEEDPKPESSGICCCKKRKNNQSRETLHTIVDIMAEHVEKN